jgi:hypothetical protein
MIKKYATNEKKPSELFLNSLTGGGSHYMVCGYCGRSHYCPESDNFYHNDNDRNDEDDAYAHYLREALAEQKKDPEGVVIHYDVDFVEAKNLAGMAFVIECPCNGLSKYEDFIWNNKNDIRNYLKRRVDQEFEWAQQQLNINKLKGIV